MRIFMNITSLPVVEAHLILNSFEHISKNMFLSGVYLLGWNGSVSELVIILLFYSRGY